MEGVERLIEALYGENNSIIFVEVEKSKMKISPTSSSYMILS